MHLVTPCATWPPRAPQSDSRFAAAYSSGLHKSKYWDPVYEDSMNLIARLPQLAAIIYRRTYRQRDYIPPSPTLDWAANLSHMMGACGRRRRRAQERAGGAGGARAVGCGPVCPAFSAVG